MRAVVARARGLAPVTLTGLAMLLSPSCGGGPEQAPDRGAPPEEPAVHLPPDATPAYERVVFVTIDTLRADHLASYGYPRSTSPFLDRIAERGLVFERCMSVSSHTAPSHASMFTGLPPGLHGLLTNGERLDPSLPTVAKTYRNAGFETAAFTSVTFLEGVTEGFDEVRAKVSAARAVSRAAITWLRTKRKSDRFLLWLHFYDPHRWKMVERAPGDLLAEMSRRDADEPFYSVIARLHGLPDPGPGKNLPRLEWHSGDRGGERIQPSSRAEVLRYVDSYDAEIAYADRELKRVSDALDGLELPGETLWVVTADHGEGLGSHDYAGHGWQIYNEQLHVPLLVSSTGESVVPGRYPRLVTTLDLFPTLLAVLGASAEGDPYRFGGRSLLPLLRSEEARSDDRVVPRDRRVFAQRRPLRSSGADGVFALQSLERKLILRLSGEDEAYDLVSDPLERSNRVAEDDAETRALRAELAGWLEAFSREGRTAVEGDATWLEELQHLGYAQ